MRRNNRQSFSNDRVPQVFNRLEGYEVQDHCHKSEADQGKCKMALESNQMTQGVSAHVGSNTSGSPTSSPALPGTAIIEDQRKPHLYDMIVTLKVQSRKDLQWWIDHLSQENGRPT